MNKAVMEIINNYKTVIIIVITVLVLVIIRSVSPNHFKPDAERWAKPTLSRTNTVTTGQIEQLSGKKLIINLDGETNELEKMGFESITINPDSLIIKKNIGIIRKHDGPVLLVSSEAAISARMWMILSQMGCKNIYILTENNDYEVFKNKFRPDSIVSPEL
jgi:hypothetical protein